MKIKFIENIENKEVKKSARTWKKELRVISKPYLISKLVVMLWSLCLLCSDNVQVNKEYLTLSRLCVNAFNIHGYRKNLAKFNQA